MKLNLGPGVLVAAAFIGPGTVTACTLAGANFGFALIWALVFATVSTIILQDMAARLGVGARLGLGEALIESARGPLSKWLIGGLVFVALVIGNCAYEGGNIAGGALGLDAVLAEASPGQNWLVLTMALFAGAAILLGRYETLERILIGLVLIMSLAFVLSALVTRPDLGALLSGLIPQIPEAGLLTAIALIGTTIVPYNLFLHAAIARTKWLEATQLRAARRDSAFSIGLGGLVSILILSTAASSLFQSELDISNAADMAIAVEPAFGAAARYLVGIGLFAAGLTSAITAPVATAYALSELLGKSDDTHAWVFRGTALFVIIVGATVSLLGIRPVSMILIAQYANGLLLPIIATFLLLVMNRKDVLGEHVNSVTANMLGGAIVLITFGLGLRSILRAAGVM
ncbi:MAG: Nramp family divalent metal transporter [Pseudomonadota bacterium]